MSPNIKDHQEDGVQAHSGGRFRRRSKALRRITGLVGLVLALAVLGVGYSAFAPTGNSAAAGPVDAETIAHGKSLFDTSCISCHGANLEGVDGKGPSLIGAGQAAVYFQLATGRMPAKANGAQMPRAIPVFDQKGIDAIAAYVQSMGGGAQLPGSIDIANADLAKGAELYRLNCASCHNFTGKGGALSQGKYAPPLNQATNTEIYAAMLSGPENMPTFSDAQLTPTEKLDIIKYVRASNDTISPGGYDLGGFGPAPEGLIAFLVGMGVIVSITLWSGSRS
ncbi:MAG: cytochrome C [Actinobacteria bacterium 69-20]|nr:c-type cytochrome [Actinomycetota bacterium]OJV25290.1 MAG: cytochrome C [Actinobacteria bacterium 69-20]